MNYLFCGGRFHFDYLKEGYLSQAADDYRVSFLGDVRKLLRGNGAVRLSEYLTYIGPFYFESDGMIDKEIVKKEMRQIQRCTHAIFLLEDGCCPGTVAEIIYAATHQKRISIFYIRDEKETESELRSPCWYPMLMAAILGDLEYEAVSCRDMGDAREKILRKVEKLSGGEV